MHILARIDPDGYLLGVEAVAELPSSLPADRVALPAGHDLHERAQAGQKPRWDSAAKHWHFEAPPTPEEFVEKPHALRAIYFGLCAVRDAGIKLPQETLDWLDWYAASIDAH